MTERLFIFGLGFSGLEIARLAKAAGWSVAGTCTSEQKAERLRADGIEAHLFDGTAALPATAIDGASHVLCTIAPGTTGDPALRTSARLLRRRALARLSLDDRRLRRSRRRLGRRGDAAQARPAAQPVTTGRRTRLAGARAGSGRRRRHLSAARHLRPRPQRDRPGAGRHGTAHRQARPGLLAHPCRGHRRHRADGDHASARRRHLQRGGRPAGFDQRRGGLRLRAAGQAGAAGHPVGTGRAHDERHGALVLCGEQGASGTTGSRTSSASCCAIRPIARACAPSRPRPRAPAPRPWRSGGRCRPGC